MFRKLFRHRWRRPTLAAIACAALLLGIGFARSRCLAGGGVLWLLAPACWLSLRRQTLAALMCMALLGFGVGWWRGSVYVQRMAPYSSLFNRKVTVIGVAQDDAVYGSHEQLTFTLGRLRAFDARGRPLDLPGTLATGGFGAAMVYRGDVVQATGKLLPANGGGQGNLGFAALTLRVANHNDTIDVWRRKFVAGMQTALPEPQASFGLGLLIGQRNTLPAAVSRQLLVVGLTHIIAVSGYNLTIILQVVRRLLIKRSKFQITALSAACIFLFLAFAGSSPSLVRAAFVSLLELAAWYYGRTIRAPTLLLLAAAMTAFVNPLLVWGNVSWYLSFLAFFGVIGVAPLVVRRVYKERTPRLVGLVAIESLCAEAMTLPYVLYVFGQISFVSLMANVLVATFVPLAMLLSLGAGVAGMMAAPIAGWFAWPGRWVLTYMLDMANLLGRIPHAFVQHVAFSAGMMATSYVVVLGIIGVMRHALRRAAPDISSAS